ncbi:MAG TPA: hypothetical protein VNY31_10950 [Solirubrobacteraceae bacterium]|nr:hypothetical protein [Solirubrobacteraceae bacterium]
MSRGRTAMVVAALSACCACASPPSAVAQTETNASMRPSLLPNRLGASSALTLAFRFSGGAEGVPAPLRGMAMHLPSGLTVNLRGAGVCLPSRLRSKGTSGCGSKSLVGRGHALMKVHAGSQAVPEETIVSIYRGPNRGSRQTLEIFSHGSTPLDQSTIATGVLTPDGGPYGSKLTVSIPAIPTLVLEPDASFVSLSLTLGGIGRHPRAHVAAGSILVPRSCPAAGFPFAADLTFAGGSTASASATIACP